METKTNSNYSPRLTYYNYKAKNYMQQELESNINTYNSINLCNYEVNTNGKYPFLRFLLINLNTNLSFPKIPKIIVKDNNKDELIQICKQNTCQLFSLNEDMYNFIEFTGFCVNDNNLYIFFDTTKCKIVLNDIYSNNLNWFVLIDEIVNHKKLCNISISNDVTNLFINNTYLCYLVNEESENYEVPIVTFVSKRKSLLHYSYSFGEFAKNKSEIFGAYYYFTNFNNGINQCIEQNLEGIVRYALFMEKTKYIEVDLNNNLITEEDFINNISDNNGIWTNTYDSVYAGEIKLNDKIYLKNAPFLVIKDYYQQIPISYHYINKLTKNSII
jgi:hypothetical protein